MKKLSEPKEKWSNAWMRWSKQQDSVQHKEWRHGSSQMRDVYDTYNGSLDVIAEAVYLEVLHKVFSDQEAKTEVSRHIANVLAPMVYHYADSAQVSYYDWLTGSWKQHAATYHEAKKQQLCFEPKYGDLWSRAKAAVKTRIDERKARRAEREAVWAKQREEAIQHRAKFGEDARLRAMPAVSEADPAVQDGGGS